MRIIKRIAVFPLIIVLRLARIMVDLIVRIECWVAGVGFLLLAILSILALCNGMWFQFSIFALIMLFGTAFLFFSAKILFFIDEMKNCLK